MYEKNQKSPNYFQGNNLILKLHVQTRASKDSIVGLYGDRLKVTITAPPIEGRANKHLIKFLAKYFSVPQKQVKIFKGEGSRDKSVSILNPKSHIAEFDKNR